MASYRASEKTIKCYALEKVTVHGISACSAILYRGSLFRPEDRSAVPALLQRQDDYVYNSASKCTADASCAPNAKR